MDILSISKYFMIIALMIFMLVALRASAYKSTSMGILGSSAVVNAFAVLLLICLCLIVGNIYKFKKTDIF